MVKKLQLKLVKRQPASRLVAEQILDQLRAGGLKVGDQLPAEKDLMQSLGVGRSSVREGLQILSTLGVLESRPGAGSFVRIPSASDQLRPELISALLGNSHALELIEARQMIEPSAARLACFRATDEDLERIAMLLAEHETLVSKGDPIHEHAARFHVLIAEASHNRIAAQFMRSIMGLLMSRGRKIDKIQDHGRREIAEHYEIFEHVKARSPDAAAEAMSSHIVRWARTYDVELEALVQTDDFPAAIKEV